MIHTIKAWLIELYQDLRHDFLQHDLRTNQARLALKTTIATLGSVWIAWTLNIANPYWAAISAMMVLQTSSGATLNKGIDRILASIIGVVCAVLLCMTLSQTPVLFFIALFLILALGGYIAAKTNNQYLWVLAPMTLLVVALNAPTAVDGTAIMNIAYYRLIEIFIGTGFAMLVSVVIYPTHATTTMKTNSQQLVADITSLYELCVQRYTTGHSDPQFYLTLKQVLTHIDKHVQMSRFVEREVLFNLVNRQKSKKFQELMQSLAGLFTQAYESYQFSLYEVTTLFQTELQAISLAKHQVFARLLEYTEGQTDLAALTQATHSLAHAIEALEDAYSRLRSEGQLHQFTVPIMTQWQQLMANQRNLCQALLNFCSEIESPTPKRPWRMQFKDLLTLDRHIWLYAIKASLLMVGLSITALWLNIIGDAGMMAITVFLVMQMDINLTKRNGFLHVAACVTSVGVVIILLSLSITSVYLYLLAFAIPVYAFAYCYHGGPKYGYMGVMGLAMLASGLVQPAPIPAAEFGNMLVLLFAILIAMVVIVTVLTWIWPFTPQNMLEHQILQLTRPRRFIQHLLIDAIHARDHAPDFPWAWLHAELDNWRLPVQALEKIQLDDPSLQPKLVAMHQSCLRQYHIYYNIMLAAQNLMLPQELEDKLPVRQFAARILNKTSTELTLQQDVQEIDAYLTQLRASTHTEGYLPLRPLLSSINLLMLLQAAAKQRLISRQLIYELGLSPPL